MEKIDIEVEEVVSYCGWRMRAPLARQLQEQRAAREAAGVHTVMENTAYRSRPAVVKAQVVKEDPTDRLFHILSDDYSGHRAELSLEAMEQLESAVAGD